MLVLERPVPAEMARMESRVRGGVWLWGLDRVYYDYGAWERTMKRVPPFWKFTRVSYQK